MALNRQITPSRAQQLARRSQREIRSVVDARESGVLKRIRAASARVVHSSELRDRITVFRDIAAQDGMTTQQLAREAATLRFRDAAQSLYQRLSAQIASISEDAQAAGMTAGEFAAIKALSLTVDGALSRPTIDRLRMMFSYTDSAAYQQAIATFPGYHSDHIIDILHVDGAMGKGPRQAASHAIQYGLNMPVADAQRMVRTLYIWSARQATRATYQENSDVVKGWIWSASLDDRVCMSCVALHGSFHELDEILDDHHQGRCAMVPVTNSWAELGFSDGQDVPGLQSGHDWFDSLSDSEQSQRMGPAMFAAYQDGTFGFDQLSTTYTDDVYGQMRREASLREIIGDESANAYRRKAA